MICYPDTSFLCALYVPQSSSSRAIEWLEKWNCPIPVTSLLLFEFRQSIQFQAFRHSNDRSQGFPASIASAALQALQSDIELGIFETTPTDWAAVHQLAEQLALNRTKNGGHRSFDILHVATSLVLGSDSLLTFDTNQKQLAELEGLAVPF